MSKNLKIKLFELVLEERTGSTEHNHKMLIEAKSYEEAEKRANIIANEWYDPEEDFTKDIEKGEYPDEYLFDYGCISVTVLDIRETTKAKWMKEQYNSAIVLGRKV